MFSSSRTANLETQLFNLKFAAKTLSRNARQCEKSQLEEERKLKTALSKQNHDAARVHAENSIRQKNQSLAFLRMSARIEGVCSRVQTAISVQNLTSSMGSVVKSMSDAAKAMDLERMMKMMDSFEKTFENLDVQSSVMEKTMDNAVTLSTPVNDVDALMRKAADEQGIELEMQIPTGPSASLAEENELAERLARLRET